MSKNQHWIGSVLARFLAAGLLAALITPGASAQIALNATKTNMVNKNHKFSSAAQCGGCHNRQYNEWAGSMMRYSSISPPIHTLERAENETDLDPFSPFAFDVKGGLMAADFGQPTFVDSVTGRFARTHYDELVNTEEDATDSNGNRVENQLFCQKCHAPVAVLGDVLPPYDMYGGLQVDTHQVLQILSKDPTFFNVRPTQSQLNARLANSAIATVSGPDAVRQTNARIATEGVTCNVCHRMNGRNTDSTGPRPNFDPGVANSGYLFEGFASATGSALFLPVFGPYNAANSMLNNGFLDLVNPPHAAFTTELKANPLTPLGSSNLLVGNDGVKRPFLASGEMCGSCHDVRIPLPDTLITDPNGKSEAFRRVENLFTEWRNSPWNNNNNAPDPDGLIVTDVTVLDNAIANPRLPARKVTDLAAISNPSNLQAGALVGKQDAGGNPIKQITTCQDCHMSRFMTDPAGLPGQYPAGTIAGSSGTIRKVADHRFIGVDRILVDQAEFGGPHNSNVAQSKDFAAIGLADISSLNANKMDPNQFNYSDIMLPPGKSDAREILLQKAVDFKIVSGNAEGPVSNRTLPIRISVENVGAGHNIPAGLSQERQVWIELYVTDMSAGNPGQEVYKSGYLINLSHATSGDPLGVDYCRDPQHEYECELAGFTVELNNRLEIENNSLSYGPDFDLVNYQNGFTRGMDSATAGQGNPILESGNTEQRREKVFSQFISDTIDNNRALKPFEKRIEQYNVDVTGLKGPFKVEARLRFRPLPPEFLENLAKNPGSRITPEAIARNKIIEMESDECIAGDPDDFAEGRRCSPIATIDAGGYHTCASVDGNTAQCWGYGFASLAQNVDDLEGVQNIASGKTHSCAILLDGTARCWGEGSAGQLGDAQQQDSSQPVMPFISDVVQMALGDDHSCALTGGGLVACWGSNANGQIGQPASTTATSYPYFVGGLSNERGEPNTIAISVGANHSCALSNMGEVRCWGSGTWGKVGDGATYSHNVYTPTLVNGLQYRATAIAAGNSHTCALMADGNVKCWGSGANGKLGNGSTASVDYGQAGDDVQGINGTALQITVGQNHSCALVDAGSTSSEQKQSVKCWGVGYALGDGPANSSDRATATDIDWGDDVLAVDAGQYHSCIVIREGSTLCWGFNGNGQIGDGTTGGFAESPTAAYVIPTTTYSATSSQGGAGVADCTAAQPSQINCTDEGTWIDLNDNTGFKWIIAGGTGGSARLSAKVGALSGTRNMSLWVNGTNQGVISINSATGPRGVGAEVDLPIFLLPGDNTVEIKDTENSMEFDLFYIRISRH